jgi:transposase
MKEGKRRTKIYVWCGKTDMRKGIDGLAAVASEYKADELFDEEALFLFCGRSKDRYKALYWEKDGFTPMSLS